MARTSRVDTAHEAVPQRDPVAEALLAVAQGYVDHAGHGVPVDVARRQEGAPAPAWLLTVALVRSDQSDLVADTLELATAAGVPRRSLGACVAYIELAAALFAGQSVDDAIRTATAGRGGIDLVAVGDAERAGPRLCGEGAVDALTAGAWALLQPGALDEVMATVAALATPGVTAAVAGLLGLRDGCGALPPTWHHGTAYADACFALTPALVRSRGHGVAHDARIVGCAHQLVGARRAGAGRAGAGGAGSAAQEAASPPLEPVEPRHLGEATRSNGSADSGAGGQTGVGVVGNVDVATTPDVGAIVAAHAITEELEAIEERVPAKAEPGVATTTATAAGPRPTGSAGRQQLQGAALR